jgi:hypothetical protein
MCCICHISCEGLLFVIVRSVFFTPFEERKSGKGTVMKLGQKSKNLL